MSARAMWPFLAPAALGATLLVVLPTLAVVGIAFTEYDAINSPRSAGFANFSELLDDPIFRTALGNSLLFIAVVVPLRLAMAVAVGLLVSVPRRGVGAARTATALPTFLPDVAVALMWVWVFNPLYGPLAGTLGALGLPGTEWLLTGWGARVAIAIMSLFLIGEALLVIAAARNEIPAVLYEVASIEGASRWGAFRAITLPMLAPVLIVLSARDVALSLQATFVPAMILYDGGPEYATTVLPLYAYQSAFEFLRFGYAAAITTVMLAVAGTAALAAGLALRRLRLA